MRAAIYIAVFSLNDLRAWRQRVIKLWLTAVSCLKVNASINTHVFPLVNFRANSALQSYVIQGLWRQRAARLSGFAFCEVMGAHDDFAAALVVFVADVELGVPVADGHGGAAAFDDDGDVGRQQFFDVADGLA